MIFIATLSLFLVSPSPSLNSFIHRTFMKRISGFIDIILFGWKHWKFHDETMRRLIGHRVSLLQYIMPKMPSSCQKQTFKTFYHWLSVIFPVSCFFFIVLFWFFLPISHGTHKNEFTDCHFFFKLFTSQRIKKS